MIGFCNAVSDELLMKTVSSVLKICLCNFFCVRWNLSFAETMIFLKKGIDKILYFCYNKLCC